VEQPQGSQERDLFDRKAQAEHGADGDARTRSEWL